MKILIEIWQKQDITHVPSDMYWKDYRLIGFDYELVYGDTDKPEIVVEPEIEETEPINYKIDFGKISRGNSYCVYCNSFAKCRGQDKIHKICLKCYLFYRTYGYLDTNSSYTSK